MYANFLQYFLIKKFVKRISSKKNMNSKFNEYHFSVINDRASTLNLKLFKDNALQLKPML
jgi:Ca2+-dependent lipid-binding protein